jgi:hypothetical protein
MRDFEYPCESCGKSIPEKEIPDNPLGAIICRDCIIDPHLGSDPMTCANCGYEITQARCENCHFINLKE